MALPLQTVDVFLSGLSETPAEHQGAIGRLSVAKEVKATHYMAPSRTNILQLLVEPRDGFTSFTTQARSIVDASISTASWTTPQLLTSLGDQLVDIDSAIPRIYNGLSWTYYPNNQILTNALTSDVFHTSQRTIGPDDYAVIGSTKCCVWTEIQNTSTGQLTTSYVGFKAKNGAWLVQPTPLYASVSTTVITQTRVVQDGTYFFVFCNTLTSIGVFVYDQHGALIGTDPSTIPLPSPTTWPGPWDVTATQTSGGYTVLLAALANTAADDGVDIYAIGWNGTTVAINHVAIGSPPIHASFRLAFLSNNKNTKAYLATMTGGETPQIHAYEITNQAVTNTYDTGVNPTGGIVDSITGYVTSASGVAVVISYSQLSTNGASSGPPNDPQLRQIHSFATVAPNITTQLRTTQSLTQVSRAFPVGDDWYSVGYYESGGGQKWAPTTINITPVLGDYFVGAATQPLAVSAGDRAVGSALAVTGAPGATGNPNIRETFGTGTPGISTGDTVAGYTATGLSAYGIADGTLLLQWKFSGLPAYGTGYVGSRLTVSGSSIAGANSTWDVVAVNTSTQVFYTATNDIHGAFPLSAGGTFTAGGTVQAIGMIGYQTTSLAGIFSGQTIGPFIGGSIVVTGSTFSNGTFTIARVFFGDGPNFGNPTSTGWGTIWVVKTTQTGENHAFSATLTPLGVNQWTFTVGDFDSTYVGAQLVISEDAAKPANVGSYNITSVQSPTTFTTGSATAILPQLFTASGATAAIQLTSQIPYTFAFGAVTADYSFLGAIVAVQGAYAPNNGTYKIVQVNADGSFVATPTNGLSNQVNEGLGPSQTVTITLSPAPIPQFQPTWFLVPLSGSQPVAGRFEYGLACSDWRTEGGASPTLFPFALTSPQVTADGVEFVLPYRAENITTSEVIQTPAGAVVIPGTETTTNTVGLKSFLLSATSGQAFSTSDQLSIPGPMAGLFTGSAFFEDGINIAPEQPFLVSQSTASSGQLALTAGATYEYVATFEYTENDGTRVFSIPSPTLEVQMSGTNNVATISGRLPFPLNTVGQPVADTYGLTCRQVSVCLYRTAWINGSAITNHYKVTPDNQTNGLAPYSTSNLSGFSFPDPFTWVFRDQTPDADLNASESLYTDQGFKARYPLPPFSRGVVWKQRKWVIGSDGAIWMSNEETENLATSCNPAFRIVLPTTDKPKTLAAMEGYLLIFGSSSTWYLPSQQLPDATGANGSLPTPVILPFAMGSKNGHAVTVSPNTPSEGIAFDSSAGGVWLIDRALRPSWLSQPVQDTLATDVTGLTVDSKQRLVIQQQTGPWLVFDAVVNTFYTWTPPTPSKLIATYLGQPVYADGFQVSTLVPGQTTDTVGATTYPIVPDFTIAPVSFANVRGVKLVHELQLVGKYLGPHGLNWVISYPDTPGATSTTGRWVPDPAKPYVFPAWPTIPDNTTFTLRVFADFNDIEPGASFALELVSAEIGVMPGGLSKVRAPGT